MRQSRGYRQSPTLLAAALVGIAVAGCADRTGEPAGEESLGEGAPAPVASTNAAPERTADPSADELPPLEPIDEKQLQAVLERHRGKIVLVDFWATWCLECLELMPHTIDLRSRLGEDRLAVVLVSLDDPDDPGRVREVLAEKGIRFRSYISRYGADPRSAEAFEIEGATLPNVKIYDREGKLHKVFSSGRMPPEPFGPESIEKSVTELVAEG